MCHFPWWFELKTYRENKNCIFLLDTGLNNEATLLNQALHYRDELFPHWCQLNLFRKETKRSDTMMTMSEKQAEEADEARAQQCLKTKVANHLPAGSVNALNHLEEIRV